MFLTLKNSQNIPQKGFEWQKGDGDKSLLKLQKLVKLKLPEHLQRKQKWEYHLSLHNGKTLTEKDVLIAKLCINEIQMGLMKVKSFAPFVWLIIIMMKA